MTDWGMVLLLLFGTAAAFALAYLTDHLRRTDLSEPLARYLGQAEDLGWPGTAMTPAGMLMMQTALDMVHRPVITEDDRATQQAVAHVAAMWDLSERVARHYGMIRGPEPARLAMRLVSTIRAFQEKNYGLTPTPEDWALCIAGPLASGKVPIEHVAKALDLIDRAVTAKPAPSSAERP